MSDIDTFREHQRAWKTACDSIDESGVIPQEFRHAWRLYHDIDSLIREVERLTASIDALPDSVHHRRCRDCGTIKWHADNITPYVLCRACGSQDTRKITSTSRKETPCSTH